MDISDILTLLTEFPTNNSLQNLGIGGVVATLGELGRRTFRSRVKSVSTEDKASYFVDKSLLKLPTDRIGYSDRVAYMMAELSHLAYFKFEKSGTSGLAQSIAEKLTATNKGVKNKNLSKLLESLVPGLLTSEGNRKVLKTILKENHFKFLRPLNKGAVQGFICKCTHPDNDPFFVVVFRGSEEKVNDWLTNADVVPEPLEGGGKVHRGFYQSIRRVENEIKSCIEDSSHNGGDSLLPVYFTGHSLGGALAILAATLISPTRHGAVYTFGAPRVANYKFFFGLKMPIFRVVNSADIVPRVPPGIIVVKPIYWISTALAKLTRFIPFFSDWMNWVASFVDKLKDYRHHGDQRYLTDVVDGKFGDSILLQNPPLADQSLWLWKGILAGTPLVAVKSHSMVLYRNKLAEIASQRN